jgi:thiol-disulfide isomerase/thioredoxin
MQLNPISDRAPRPWCAVRAVGQQYRSRRSRQGLPARRRWPSAGGVLLLLGVVLTVGCSRPDVRLADGQGARWSQWEGRWLIINYWAEWCAPCRVEIPELNELHREGAAANVTVLGVNFDGVSGPALDRLIDLFAIEFPVLLDDPGARWEQSRPTVLPTTLIIDPHGALHSVLVGPQTFESIAAVVGL